MAARWTADEDRTLQQMIEEGATVATIASTLGRSETSIRTRMRDAGIVMKTEGAEHRARGLWDDATKALVLELLSQGKSRDEIGKAVGLRSDNIKLACQRNGLSAEYEDAMAARRYTDGAQNVREASNAANAAATEKLAKALAGAGMVEAPKVVERRHLTFEEQLALVRAGKARVVANVKVERHPTYVPMAGAMS